MGWPGPVTYRQYKAWMSWLDDQWNSPDRHDFYLMQIAAEVRRPNVKTPSRVQMKDFVVKFEERGSKRKLSQAQKDLMNRLNKSKWLAVVGLNNPNMRK